MLHIINITKNKCQAFLSFFFEIFFLTPPHGTGSLQCNRNGEIGFHCLDKQGDCPVWTVLFINAYVIAFTLN